MNIEKIRILKRVSAKRILSLGENGCYWHYYELCNSIGLHVFLLNQLTTSLQQDDYAIYFNWQHLIKDLNCCKSKTWLPIKNKWWSYCPKWLYLNPTFIDNNFRSLINNELCKSLDRIFENDLSEAEILRFKIWMKACEADTLQLNLFD